VAFAAGTVLGVLGLPFLAQLPMRKIAKTTNASMKSFMETSPGF